MTVPAQHTRAFVVQFQATTDPGAGRFDGLAEHVATGRVRRFHSLEQLQAFLVQVLADADGEPDADD